MKRTALSLTRRALLVGTLLIGAMLLGSCGNPTESGSNGKLLIRFWNGFSGPDGATMRKIVDQFNASQKEIEVKMEIIPWATYYDKTTLGLAFGGAPDLFVIQTARFPEFVSHGVLEPVDDRLKAAGLGPEMYFPQTYRAMQWEGKSYALPLDIFPMGLYYNRKMFDEAGIANPPTTYEEFLAAAKKLTKRLPDGTMQWGFAFTYLPTNAWLFMDQYGGDLLAPDLSRAAMDSPENRAALSQMKEIIYKYKVAPKPEAQDAWLGFRSGRVAMAFEGVYMKTDLDNAKIPYAGAPVPQFGPKQATWGGSHMLCMPKGNDPKKLDAAWKFATFLSANSLEWAKGGQVPARKDIIANPEFQSLPLQSQFAKGLPYLKYETPSVDFNLVATFKDSAVEKILNNLTSMDEALTTADRRINNVLERSGREKKEGVVTAFAESNVSAGGTR